MIPARVHQCAERGVSLARGIPLQKGVHTEGQWEQEGGTALSCHRAAAFQGLEPLSCGASGHCPLPTGRCPALPTSGLALCPGHCVGEAVTQLVAYALVPSLQYGTVGGLAGAGAGHIRRGSVSRRAAWTTRPGPVLLCLGSTTRDSSRWPSPLFVMPW